MCSGSATRWSTGMITASEMDADFSHPPDVLPKFIELLTEYDLIIGSRYSEGVVGSPTGR